MKKFFDLLSILLVSCIFCGALFSAETKGKFFSWDFTDCTIKDVLFAVSMDAGIPIIADDTVSGKCDLRFIGNDFEKAFGAFLESNRLYLEKQEDLWTVSRFKIEALEGLYNLDACDILPSVLIEKLSQKIESSITFDSLPSEKISLHFKRLSEKELMEKLAKSLGQYEVLSGTNSFHFARKKEAVSHRQFDFESFVAISRNQDERYEVNIRDGKFSDILESLFEGEEGKNYCILGNADAKIQRSVFCGRNFEDTLLKLSKQGGFSYVLSDEVYYFIASSNAKNELISGQRNWERFNLKFVKPEAFISIMQWQLGKIENFVLPNQNAFYALVSEKEKTALQKLILDTDEKQSTYLVALKYLHPDEVLKHLPPEVSRESLVLADDNSCLYFTGTEEAYKNLCSQLELCDRPVQRLSYDLLILQYDEGKQNDWSPVFNADKMRIGDRSGASALLGSVMNLNMNVVGTFGMTFAASLQNSIEENRTKVFADTTLHGVSGKKITFQNTNTYRYRDNNLDPETGKPVYSGVTREITSGIKLEVLGWVSGDGMITSTVTASVSRQGVDTSSSTGNPPPTTEKIVTTEVRGKSGEPVVLSGLIQNSDTKEVKRVPLISKFPLLGWLFKKQSKIKESSQMVIYLVPTLENEKKYAANEKQYDREWAFERIKGLSASVEKAACQEG